MTSAAEVRERAEYTLEVAARLLGVTPRYLRQCERSGFPFVLASKAARLYGGRLDDFLPRKNFQKEREAKQTRSS